MALVTIAAFQVGRNDALAPLAIGYRGRYDEATGNFLIQYAPANSLVWTTAFSISPAGVVSIPLGGGVDWGDITGTLSTQADLQAALDLKVATSDSRLTDARTPLAHAASHGTAGADPLSVLALGGYPGGTTTYLRADGSFASVTAAAGDLTGPVTSVGLATAIANNAITDAMVAGLTASKLTGALPAISGAALTSLPAAAAGTLTGATLAAGVTASSLTSTGTLTGGATGAGFTVALSTSTITGTLADARLSTNVPLKDAANVFLANQSVVVASTSSFSGMALDQNKAELVLRAYGSTFSAFTHAGVALASYGEIWADSVAAPGPLGLLIGLGTNAPIHFATNNVVRATLQAGLSIGDTTDPGAGGFRCGVMQNFSWNTKSINTVYQAASDGLVVVDIASTNLVGTQNTVQVFTDASNPPTTECASWYSANVAQSMNGSITCPVRKGDYYKIATYQSAGGTLTITSAQWVPLGFNG